jgi:hypothetical protein
VNHLTALLNFGGGAQGLVQAAFFLKRSIEFHSVFLKLTHRFWSAFPEEGDCESGASSPESLLIIVTM